MVPKIFTNNNTGKYPNKRLNNRNVNMGLQMIILIERKLQNVT